MFVVSTKLAKEALCQSNEPPRHTGFLKIVIFARKEDQKELLSKIRLFPGMCSSQFLKSWTRFAKNNNWYLLGWVGSDYRPGSFLVAKILQTAHSFYLSQALQAALACFFPAGLLFQQIIMPKGLLWTKFTQRMKNKILIFYVMKIPWTLSHIPDATSH